MKRLIAVCVRRRVPRPSSASSAAGAAEPLHQARLELGDGDLAVLVLVDLVHEGADLERRRVAAHQPAQEQLELVVGERLVAVLVDERERAAHLDLCVGEAAAHAAGGSARLPPGLDIGAAGRGGVGGRGKGWVGVRRDGGGRRGTGTQST